MFDKLSTYLDFILNKPSRVFLYGTLITITILIVDGSFWRFWNLYQNKKEMEKRIEVFRNKSKKLDFEIHQAEKLSHIERQAIEHFNYVRENDLIFVFPE